MADRCLKYTMESDVGGIYEQIKNMKAEPLLTVYSKYASSENACFRPSTLGPSKNASTFISEILL